MVLSASLQEIAQAILPTMPQGAWIGRENQQVTGVSTDSRAVEPGNLFVALRGESFDGHQFVEAALAQGAIAALVDQPGPWGETVLSVPDTLAAYQRLGQWWRQRLGLPVVAITGSVGKTTTKEFIAAALGLHGRVLKTEKNFNNEIGVPKTLLSLAPDHDFAVVEMGMRGRGQIALLAQLAQPTVAVITNVGTAHIGLLGSEQAIAEAKCELLAQLNPRGIAVLNGENARLMATAPQVWAGPTLTFGLTTGDVQGTLLDENTLQVGEHILPLPLPGRHQALNLLAAIAVLQALDLDWTALVQGLSVSLPPGRGRKITLDPDIILLDETYNAGVESMEAALALLAQTPGQRRIAVLGTMKELGDHSCPLHQRVGKTLKTLGIDQLLILADPPEAEALANGAAGVPSQAFTEPTTLVAHLQATLCPGDRVLFKASRSVALDRVVSALLPTP